MQVQIKATTIGTVLNADVIHVGQLEALSAHERDELLAGLIQRLSSQTAALAEKPEALTLEHIRSAGERLADKVRPLHDGATPETAQSTATGLLETLRHSFGSITDIVVNAVKLAQVAGLHG